MKKMIYKEKRTIEVLDEGFENGIKYVIMSLGSHPCCYIGIEENHPLAGHAYDDIPLNVHGGLTYSKKGNDEYLPKGYWWYGWDYAHAGDYTGYSSMCDKPEDRKYTTKDLKSDVWHATWNFSKIKSLMETAQ